MKVKLIYILCFLVVRSICFSQSPSKEQLIIDLKAAKHDTSRINILNQLSREYIVLGDYLKADSLLQLAIKLEQRVDFKKGAFHTETNSGVVYWYQDNFPISLQHHFKALKLAEEMKDHYFMSRALANIGLVFLSQKEYSKSLDYYFKAQKLKDDLNDKKGSAVILCNIGDIYKLTKENDQALKYYQSSLKLSEELQLKGMIGLNLSHMGDIYFQNGNDQLAEENYLKALILAYDIKDQVLISGISTSLGSLYIKQQKYTEAEKHLKTAFSVSKQIGDLGNKSDACKALSELYSAQKKWELSMTYYKMYSELKDSIFNENKTKDIVKNEMNFEFDKKRAIEKVEQEKKDAIADEELKWQKRQRNYFIFGFGMMLLLAVFIFRGYRQKQKANKIIAAQKHEVELQKERVEEQQKDILDSINYAKRIQYALLASNTLLTNNLPEYFVLFKPKDVVSGDFYWATPTPTGFLYITADCTGHGVPGAFMSLLNIAKLSQTINENKIYRPDLILNNVRTEIINVLNPPGSVVESKDGMDAVLCKLDLQNMKLQYAAAHNSFYIIRHDTILHLKADKMPVGKGHDDDMLFTYNEFSLQKGDTIYTFTDGYADQFGGEKGKKFKYKQLEELLLSIKTESMERQSEILLERFNQWKGNLEQVDDVCIIGVRV